MDGGIGTKVYSSRALLFRMASKVRPACSMADSLWRHSAGCPRRSTPYLQVEDELVRLAVLVPRARRVLADEHALGFVQVVVVAPRQLVNQSLLDQTNDRSRGNQKNSPVKAYGERTSESRTGRGVWSWHFSPRSIGQLPRPRARRTLLQVRVSPSTLCRPTIWNDHLSMKMHDRHNVARAVLRCPGHIPKCRHSVRYFLDMRVGEWRE